ncbi:hypothetical protein NW762_013547 [Fusarium torreyae]|uniref:BZIP domain-containing protein n=1 Tax=Fusarium torreyae TaxID=1237075 RepID=A0A9W8RM02_9HYPO|nr:hypothetical protein NW762_013547 [Fusarium torreyae]
MTAQSSPKKRSRMSNGSHDVEDAALKARRERNREAQNIFRRRRQAAEAAQAQRVRRLEQVVEEMSSVFMSFVDEMLTTEAVVSGQPSLVGSLRRSMERILELAHEVVGPEEDLVVLPRSASETSPEESKSRNSHSPESEQSETTSEGSSSLAVTLRRVQPPTSTPRVASHQSPHMNSHQSPHFMTSQSPYFTNSYQSPPFNSHQSPPFVKPFTSFNLPPQIFGNGWLGTTPSTGDITASMPVPAPNTPPSTFAHRLAHASLSVACHLLTNPPIDRALTPPEIRLFSNGLKGRAKDEMLTRLRWLLGPGKNEMHRVIDLPYGRYGHYVYSRNELSPSTADDIEWPWPSRPAGTHIDHFSRFFSIVGVEKQLLALGARVVDADTLELNINNSPMPDVSDVVPKQPESWSFVNCFSFPTQPKSSTVTVRLSIPALVSSLAMRSVCLMRGPGIPRAEIGSAIEEAIIRPDRTYG